MSSEALVDFVARAFTPQGARAFTLLGVRHEADAEPQAEDGAAATGGALTEGGRALLTDALYARVHCRLPADPWARDARGSARMDAREFTRLLSAANDGTGTWQHGWLVREIAPDGTIVAESTGVRFWCAPPDVRVAAGKDARPARAGDRAQVFIPKEYRQLVPGYYMATGNADDDMDAAATVRVYFNVKAPGAVVFVGTLIRTLNAARIAFRFKTQGDPRNFGRADSAVLYLRRERYASAAPVVAHLASAMRGNLDAGVPGFAKALAPGVSVAEDPGDGLSLGQHRSRMLANALGSAASMRAASPAERAAVLRAALAADGYDPEALHLNPGSRDSYAPFESYGSLDG